MASKFNLVSMYVGTIALIWFAVIAEDYFIGVLAVFCSMMTRDAHRIYRIEKIKKPNGNH